jgi:hypothetical protein
LTKKETELMSFVKVARLSVVAAAVLSTVVVTNASAAAPEFGRCLKAATVKKVFTGRFSDSACTKEVPEAERGKLGKYEWHPGAVKKFQTTAGGKGALATVGGLGVHCETEHSKGEYSGTKEVKNVVVKFNGCESAGAQCSTTGSASGELVTKTLEGVVGFINKAALKTGFDLYPEGKTGLFIEFACLGLTVAVRGSVIVPITADKMLLTGTLKYVAKGGRQEVEHFEGEANDVLEASFRGGAFEQSGQTISTTLTDEEKLELNAVI